MTVGRNIIAAASAAAVGIGIYTMSELGTVSIQQHEGVVYNAYPDPYYGWQVPTICTGHTKHAKKGLTVTEAQCKEWLKEDLAEATAILNRDIKPYNITLTQGEADAYISFIFNMGPKWKNTPSVFGRLRAGDHIGACKGLLKYTYSNGKYSRGLANRRQAEYKLCIRDLTN